MSKNLISSNIRKTWLIFSFFFLAVIGLGWFFAGVYQNPGILYFASIFSIGMSLVSYWYSDKLAISMAGGKPLEKSQAPEVYEIIERLIKAADLPMPKIYFSQEKQINAFATGRNPQKAAVLVTAGSLEKLSRQELEGVLAHELSHVGNRDILVSTVAVILVGFISMISNIFMSALWWGGLGGNRDNRDRGPNILMIVGIVAAILAPIGAMLLQLAISRRREILADISGANLTKKPQYLADALEKIGRDQTPMLRVKPATAHLWISDPFRGQRKTRWLVKLFLTHPPVEERIKTLRELKI